MLTFFYPQNLSSTSLLTSFQIYLTVDLVSKFGKPEYAAKLQYLPSLLESVVNVLITRFAATDIVKIQAYAVDLIISDYLRSSLGVEQSGERLRRFVAVYPSEL